MPGAPLGRLNQTPKQSSAIGMRPAIHPDGGHGFPAIVGYPSAPSSDLAWVALIVFSAATMLSHNTAVFFPLATNIFVLGLMLFQRIRESGLPPRPPGALFWELGEGSDRHLPAMESMDRFLYQASQRSLSEVLDS